MKRLFTAALSAALLLSLALPSSAAGTGRAVDWALYTDITAQINGHPLRSYNVNGSTAVVAEDLRGYGFQVLWDAEDRTLSVERAADSTGCPALPASWPDYTPPALTQPVGTRAQPILSTDIDTYVAGQYVRSCNIGGETLICFSDLAPYGAVSFDEDSRTAELTLGDDPAHGGCKRVYQCGISAVSLGFRDAICRLDGRRSPREQFPTIFCEKQRNKTRYHQSSSRLYGWVSLFRPLSGHRTG